MNVRDRIQLKRRLAECGASLENNPHFARRVDREESARATALFLEYARQHRLSPGEAQSLLQRAAHDATRALDELDGPRRSQPIGTPGREAAGSAQVRDTPGRSSGRTSNRSPGRR